MPEPFVTTREFDGFIESIRGEMREVSDFLKILGGKLDALLLKSNEEARQMGELHATVRAIGDRLARIEDDNRVNKSQIDELWEHHSKHQDGKLRWWGDVIVVGIAAICGAVVTKIWK